MERGSGRPRARTGLGGAGRFAPVPDPDGTVVESAGARLEPSAARGLDPSSSCFVGLGPATARDSGSTADRRTFVERACAGPVGRTQNRRARGAPGAVMVGSCWFTRRTGRSSAALERAGAGRCARTSSLVATRTGPARARHQLHGRCARRRRFFIPA